MEGYLKIMKERQVGENLSDYDAMIDRSLERIKGMRNLIMDLMDLTRLESGKKVREMKKVDLNQVARIAMDTMEPMAIQKNVKMYLDAPENLIMQADPDEIEIIVNNLVSNAVKYNRDGGSVNVVMRQSSSTLNIKVEDTGIGMKEEDIKPAFPGICQDQERKNETDHRQRAWAFDREKTGRRQLITARSLLKAPRMWEACLKCGTIRLISPCPSPHAAN